MAKLQAPNGSLCRGTSIQGSSGATELMLSSRWMSRARRRLSSFLLWWSSSSKKGWDSEVTWSFHGDQAPELQWDKKHLSFWKWKRTYQKSQMQNKKCWNLQTFIHSNHKTKKNWRSQRISSWGCQDIEGGTIPTFPNHDAFILWNRRSQQLQAVRRTCPEKTPNPKTGQNLQQTPSPQQNLGLQHPHLFPPLFPKKDLSIPRVPLWGPWKRRLTSVHRGWSKQTTLRPGDGPTCCGWNGRQRCWGVAGLGEAWRVSFGFQWILCV